MISSVLHELSQAIAARRLVSMVRREPLAKLYGFPLAVGSKLLLLRDVHPEILLPDGYSVVRVQDIAQVDTAEVDRTIERILRAESLVPDPAEAPGVRLDGWAGALGGLLAQREALSLDCEDDEDGYFLGALTGVYEDGVDIRHIGPDGAWDAEDWTLDPDSITRIVLRSRYIQAFSRLAGDLPDDSADE